MKDLLCVGLIGAGWIAQHHAAGYLRSGKARVAGVCDRSETQARALMARQGLDCRFHADYRSLLDDAQIDAVSICLPNALHSEVTVAAAQAGKHILCEKPFVTSPAEAARSLAAIRESGVRCAVGFHRRFNPLYQEMKRLADEGRLGEIFFCQCDYIHYQMHLPIIAWQLKKESNPSLFHAGASHCVDLLRYIMGCEIVECAAFAGTLSCPECETEAETVALYRFSSGAIGKVMRIAPTPVTGFEFHLELYGTKGTFKDNVLRLDSFPRFWEAGSRDHVVTYPDWIPTNIPGITEPWDVEVAHFVDWILNGSSRTPLCQPLDAVRVAEACWAAVISNREKRLVKLPLGDDERLPVFPG